MYSTTQYITVRLPESVTVVTVTALSGIYSIQLIGSKLSKSVRYNSIHTFNLAESITVVTVTALSGIYSIQLILSKISKSVQYDS